MPDELTPVQTRAKDPAFVQACSLDGLSDRLPLRWPLPADTPRSPKISYRSHYVYRGWKELEDPSFWAYASDFDLLLRIVDFAPLRPVLAQLLGWTSARGQIPFDPVSSSWWAGRSPKAGTAPRPCAPSVTLVTPITLAFSGSSTRTILLKAASAVS